MANSVWVGPFGTFNGSTVVFPTNTAIDVQATNLQTTSTDGAILEDITAATAGATVQMSPRLRLRGTAWDTGASETVDFSIENLPASAATPTGTLKFGYSLNGAAITYPLTLSSIGRLTALGDIFTAATGSFSFTSRSAILCNADAQLNLVNNGNTIGFGLDFGTDAVMKIRTRAQSGYATVDCLGLKASGVAGANFGPAAVASLTVVNGIVTAAS